MLQKCSNVMENNEALQCCSSSLTALCRIQGYKLAVQCLTVNECNQSGCGVVHLGYARSIFRMLRDDQKCLPTHEH